METTTKRQELREKAFQLYRGNLSRRTYCMLLLGSNYADDESINDFLEWFNEDQDHAIDTLYSGNNQYKDHFNDWETFINLGSDVGVRHSYFACDYDVGTGEPIDLEDYLEDFAMKHFEILFHNLDIICIYSNTYAIFDNTVFSGIIHILKQEETEI